MAKKSLTGFITGDLTLDELKQLGSFLEDSFNEQGQAMSLTELHGFLCAVVSGPRMVLPSLWLTRVLESGFTFDSQEELGVLITLVSRLHNQIFSDLRESSFFDPLLFEEGEVVPYESASLELIREWCFGYLEGTSFDPLWDDEDMEVYLLPFACLVGALDIEEDSPFEEGGEKVQEVRDLLPELISSVFHFWQEDREEGEPLQNDASWVSESFVTKTGRNDPCPCGSGKKYKKCCLKMNRI